MFKIGGHCCGSLSACGVKRMLFGELEEGRGLAWENVAAQFGD